MSRSGSGAGISPQAAPGGSLFSGNRPQALDQESRGAPGPVPDLPDAKLVSPVARRPHGSGLESKLPPSGLSRGQLKPDSIGLRGRCPGVPVRNRLQIVPSVLQSSLARRRGDLHPRLALVEGDAAHPVEREHQPLETIVPEHAPDIIEGIRRRVQEGRDEVLLAPRSAACPGIRALRCCPFSPARAENHKNGCPYLFT